MGKDPFSNMKVIWDAGQYMCENVLKSGVLHELYNSSAHYDLVLAHIFAYDCFSVFAHKFDTPVVSVVSSSALPWANPRVGNPEHPAFVINNYVDTDEHMGLYMRVLNTLAWLWSTVGTSQYNYAYNDEAVRKLVGDLTTILIWLQQFLRDEFHDIKKKEYFIFKLFRIL